VSAVIAAAPGGGDYSIRDRSLPQPGAASSLRASLLAPVTRQPGPLVVNFGVSGNAAMDAGGAYVDERVHISLAAAGTGL